MTLVSTLTIDPVLFADELPFVMGCLCQVLQESGEPELARVLPWLADDASTPEVPDVPVAGLAQVLSIAFQLLSIVEQRVAVQYRRTLETRKDLAGEPVDAVPRSGGLGGDSGGGVRIRFFHGRGGVISLGPGRRTASSRPCQQAPSVVTYV